MWRLVLGLAVVLELVLPSTAAACSCMPGGQLFPPEGSIPPNVTFYAARVEYRQLMLLDESGTRMPLAQEEIGDKILRLRPSAPLQEGRKYTLEVDPGPNPDPNPDYKLAPLARYTVRGEPDTQPPQPPTSVDFDYEHSMANLGSSCESEKEGYFVDAKGASDDRVPAGQLATVVVPASAPDRILALLPPSKHFIGHSTCLYNFDVDKARGTQVALRSVDLAGNLSKPSPAAKLAKGTPLVVAMFLQTIIGRGVIVLVVAGLIGMVLLVVRRSPREGRTQ